MTGKEHPQKPKPGLPEAIHPEIGNGALWTDDPHELNLRSADPVSQLDFQLLDPEEREAIIQQWASPVNPESEEKQSIPEDIKVRKPGRHDRKISHSAPEREPAPDWLVAADKISLADESPHPPTENEEPVKVVTGQETEENDQHEEINIEGKRVKKAIKKARKAARKKETENEPVAAHRPDLGLSPFASWLKNLRGSEYIHPYEDDFGFEQLNSTTREGISETFADLLAAQGYKDQAIDMYQLLMAKYPEKSSFFAAKIEALK